MRFKVAVSRRLRRLLGLDLDAKQADIQATRLEHHVLGVRDASTFAAISALSDRYRDGTTLDLRLAELKVFSQNGEDGILCALLTALGIDRGTFVEFGSEDGSECCTRFLAEILGWSGRYIEPDPHAFARLEERWAHTDRIDTIHAAVTPDNISHLVPDCDLLVIDVDGQDFWLWQAVEIEPAVVVIEFNAALGDEVEPAGTPWTEPHPRAGAGLTPLRKLGESKGYRLVHTDACAINAFFVRSDLPFVGITDRSPNYWLGGRGHAD